MANNIVIDIVADTRSLVRGVNETNAKLNTLNGSVSKVTGAFLGLRMQSRVLKKKRRHLQHLQQNMGQRLKVSLPRLIIYLNSFM